MAIFLAVGTLVLLGGCSDDQSEPEFNGTVLKGAEPSPPFDLTNQIGQAISLESFQDRVVVLTFLYTYCPDVCPIITSQLRDVQDQLADDGSGVEFVAISVDPERDTVEAAQDYLRRWKIEEEWQYLVGDRETLEPIWESYFVDPYAEDSGVQVATPEPRGAIDALSAAITERYLVIHSAPVFLIDRGGSRRVVFTSPLSPEEIVQDVRRLLQ
ncbi:MAG: SCO family protein [Dehalococcoidia bacterium]|nr:SCO family protein [Dehalococcoidia bacterium]